MYILLNKSKGSPKGTAEKGYWDNGTHMSVTEKAAEMKDRIVKCIHSFQEAWQCVRTTLFLPRKMQGKIRGKRTGTKTANQDD